MASRKLCNRSYSGDIQAGSDYGENMKARNVMCFESDDEVTVRENPALEEAEQNANIVATTNDNVTNGTESDIDKGSISATEFEELLSTLMQTIRSESCKQTAALITTVVVS
jgi:hypothetical protein